MLFDRERGKAVSVKSVVGRQCVGRGYEMGSVVCKGAVSEPISDQGDCDSERH